MTRWSNTILYLLSAALGIALGYAARGIVASSARATANIAAPKVENSVTDNAGKSINPEEDQFTHIISVLRDSETLAGRNELFRVLSSVRAAELPGLIDRAQKLPLKLRNELTTALFEHWMEVDRTAAEQWIRKEGRARACYTAWARMAPQDALDDCFGSGRPYWAVVPTALDRLVGKDPRARLNLLAAYARSYGRNAAIGDEFEWWARSDPASALSWATTFPDEKIRKILEKTGITELAKKDPKAATSRIQEMIPEMEATMVGNGFISEFTRGLATKDPAAAREFAENLPEGFQTYPMIAAGCAWAKKEPIASLDWAYANGINVTQNFRTETGHTTFSILREAMSAEPKQTVDWLLALPAGNDRDLWLQNALSQDPLRKDPELARRVFDSLPAERHPRLAQGFGWQIGAGGQLPDLQTLASWFPDESIRARVIGGAMAGAFDKTPSRVEAMLGELPTGPLRDQALAALTQGQSYSAPNVAASRALEIRDETVRYDALDRLMNRWMNRDRKTAEDWLNSQPDLPREWVAEWMAIKGY